MDQHLVEEVVEEVSKMLKYGSTQTLTTISTDTYTPSSSSASSSDNCNNNAAQMHHMRLDMSSIDSDNTTGSDSTEMSNLLTSKRRTRSDDSSFSDISSVGGGGGYYSRYASHRNKSRNARYFIQNSVFTVNNFKVVLSFASWFVSYMIMGVFGGSVAYLHFERSDRSVPAPLPDFGYDAIPVSYSVALCVFICCGCDVLSSLDTHCDSYSLADRMISLQYRRNSQSNLCTLKTHYSSLYSTFAHKYRMCHTETSKALSCSFYTRLSYLECFFAGRHVYITNLALSYQMAMDD